MTVVSIHVPSQTTAPRGSVVAANWAFWLLSRLQVLKAQRAERRLVEDRRAEAAAVRRLAREMSVQDPRFAADLLAAADRHEAG
jgi:hypothetical protein